MVLLALQKPGHRNMFTLLRPNTGERARPRSRARGRGRVFRARSWLA
jgi:hypothetical protein